MIYELNAKQTELIVLLLAQTISFLLSLFLCVSLSHNAAGTG